jgi:hypothetical protein
MVDSIPEEIRRLTREWTFERTVGLYAKHPPTQRAVFQGSGVLLKIETRAFILTAAHVVRFLHDHKNEGSSLWVATMGPIQIPMYTLAGSQIIYNPSDDYDIAIIPLGEAVARALSEAKRFLRLGDLERGQDLLQGAYCVLGFPAQHNTPDYETKEINVTPFMYTSLLDTEVLDAKPGVTIALKWTKTVIYDSQRNELRMPELKGISGCGIWRLFITEKHGYRLGRWSTDLIRLVGIEHRITPRKRIKGTIVANALIVIAHLYPDLHASMSIITEL